MAETLARLTRDWLTKAAHDLQNARIVSASADGPLDTAIYHCQQAAEKSLKAWLVWRGISVPKTHDLVRLVMDAETDTPEFAQFEEAAEILTPYASAFRYPGLTEDMMPARGEFASALLRAESIHNFVVSLLPQDARP